MLSYKDNKQAAIEPCLDEENCFYVLSVAELEELDCLPDIKSRMAEGFDAENCDSKYENYDGHDMFYINVTDELKDKNSLRFLGAYISRSNVFCVYEEWEETPYILDIIKASMGRGMSYKKAVLSVIDSVTRDDFAMLEKIDDDIEKLEDQITENELEETAENIGALKKRLRPMKRFYEQLMDIFEDLDENENELFSDSELKYASRIYGRIERQYKTVLNLRDYLTQVREAYQAQTDLELNNIMKTFTVITAIFLPLTLLAGWYGMNLIMPEFDWSHGYVYVIALSIAIVVGCLALFKWKRWF